MPVSSSLYDSVLAASRSIRQAITTRPRVGIVLGSGLSQLADRVQFAQTLRYVDIPFFPPTSVAGHDGRLVAGAWAGCPVVVLQGRYHFYEGHDLSLVTLPIRVLAHLGIHTLILTAAAGAISPNLQVQDIACIRDHINLLGANPLRGLNDDRLGPRFLDLTTIYDPTLRLAAQHKAQTLNWTLPEVVYAAMPGPSYETPAEINLLRTLGADVVGMSTVPEAIVARQCRLRVLAFTLITNAAAGLGPDPISHQDVLAAGRSPDAQRLADLIERLLSEPVVSQPAEPTNSSA
jgi:purine-nucleoside phosphorylase